MVRRCAEPREYGPAIAKREVKTSQINAQVSVLCHICPLTKDKHRAEQEEEPEEEHHAEQEDKHHAEQEDKHHTSAWYPEPARSGFAQPLHIRK